MQVATTTCSHARSSVCCTDKTSCCDCCTQNCFCWKPGPWKLARDCLELPSNRLKHSWLGELPASFLIMTHLKGNRQLKSSGECLTNVGACTVIMRVSLQLYTNFGYANVCDTTKSPLTYASKHMLWHGYIPSYSISTASCNKSTRMYFGTCMSYCSTKIWWQCSMRRDSGL